MPGFSLAKVGLLFITHDRGVVTQVADRLAGMYAGEPRYGLRRSERTAAVPALRSASASHAARCVLI